MSIFYPACPSLTSEAWFNSTSVYDDETYIDALEAQAKAWKLQYECCGTAVQPIGKSADLDGSQIEDEDDIVQEEIESDSEFDEASPDAPVPEPERTNASVDMTF